MRQVAPIEGHRQLRASSVSGEASLVIGHGVGKFFIYIFNRFGLDAGYPNGDSNLRGQIIIGFAAPLDALELGD